MATMATGGMASRASLAALAARLTSGGYGGGAPAALKRSAPEGGSGASAAAVAAPEEGASIIKRAKREAASSAHEGASSAAAPSASSAAAAAPPAASAAAASASAVQESEDGALELVDVSEFLGSACLSCGDICGKDAKLRLVVIGEIAVAFPGIGMAERIGNFVGFEEPPWVQCEGAGCDEVLCSRYVGGHFLRPLISSLPPSPPHLLAARRRVCPCAASARKTLTGRMMRGVIMGRGHCVLLVVTLALSTGTRTVTSAGGPDSIATSRAQDFLPTPPLSLCVLFCAALA